MENEQISKEKRDEIRKLGRGVYEIKFGSNLLFKIPKRFSFQRKLLCERILSLTDFGGLSVLLLDAVQDKLLSNLVEDLNRQVCRIQVAA